MVTSFKNTLLVIFSTCLLSCSATQNTSTTGERGKNTNQSAHSPALKTNFKVIDSQSTQKLSDFKLLTLEKIMSDPDWIGRQPEKPYWSLDGKSIYYSQKRLGSPIKDLWNQSLELSQPPTKVPLQDLHIHSLEQTIYNSEKSMVAWIFENNAFVKDLKSNQIHQITRNSGNVRNLQFLTDGRLSYLSGYTFYAVDISSGFTEELASWTFSEKPKALEKSKDYIAKEQIKLISVLSERRQKRQIQFDHKQQIAKSNPSIQPNPFYFSAENRLVEVSLSPNGKFAILVEEKDTPRRDKTDIMPNYVVDSGRIEAQSVRKRVADAKPQSQISWLLDLTKHTKKKLSYSDLPGYNDDVLADVKKENAEARGETYEVNRLPRDIQLLNDWSWQQSAIQWHPSGEEVAIMLEAWDNKDRWLATVDWKTKTLKSQHRLHDEAWINYRFNSYGWFRQTRDLYYLSEESGYSQLYVKSLTGPSRALTSGQYEVNGLVLSQDENYIYFQANKTHPGIYEVYRVSVDSGELEQLTELNGQISYKLSHDESKLLLTHSKLTVPPELYIKDLNSDSPASKITKTVSDEFLAINWLAPKIVPIASSHASQPIFSRVYLPENHLQGEKKRAVVFNHGAGYLQNSHLGWSSYFREFMFHNMLVQQGYVVLDMDYRASAGYGRDWRTAIYRHMGKPETQDLVDGVNWLVENANVDRKRVGTYGGSYGGFMAFMALFTEPELFQAGAALRPVSDWAHYNHGYTSNILNTPDVDPIAYERSSPIYFAEGLNKPLLINAPMVDSNVFFVDVVRLVQRLIELEKEDFETAIYPVESHGFVEPSSWLDEYRRIYKLFEQNL